MREASKEELTSRLSEAERQIQLLEKKLAKAIESLKEVQTRTAHMESKHALKLNRYVTLNLKELE